LRDLYINHFSVCQKEKKRKINLLTQIPSVISYYYGSLWNGLNVFTPLGTHERGTGIVFKLNCNQE
jgi:hypothetical protein